MKRFLAGILSAVLIIGSIPVYGAENQEIAAQDENIQNTELLQGSEESDHGDSFGDAESAVEENNPEEGDNSIQNPEEIPAVTEAPELTETPEQEPEITEVPEEEVPEEENPEEIDFNDEEIQVEDAGEEKPDYLEHLTVYTSQSSTASEAVMEPERREDLDEAFGGKVYTVEYSSYATSSSLYLSADISDSAPESSTVSMRALLTTGGEKTQVMNPKAYTEGLRYRLNGRTFANGVNGGKRAVYTITAGTEEDIQTYKLVVLRRLDLSFIGYRSGKKSHPW